MLHFKPSEGISIGMEMEFQLLDPATLDLVDGILPLLKSLSGNPYIRHEFNQATVEINSRISRNINELESNVYTIARTLKQRCHELGMTMAGAGTHPFSSRLSTITPLPRYLAMERMGGYLCHTLVTFALHVHVGMSTGEETISVMRNLRPYLPVLMALSANSPFWWGYDTGYACYRQRVLAAMRSYGLPPRFDSWEEFSDFFKSADRADVFHTFDDIHWDIRPRPDLGTLEVRVMDVQPTVKEAIMIASFVHALVEFFKKSQTEKEGENLIMPCPYWVLKENHFRASCMGIEAVFIEDDKGNTRPFRKVIEDVLSAVSETAAGLGEGERLRLLEKYLDGEPGYKRQRRVFNESGSLKEVAVSLVRELEEDLDRFDADRSGQEE